MGKLTNEERARLDGLAKAYAEKAKANWNKVYNSLNDDQKVFIGGYQGKINDELMQCLNSGKKPSDYFAAKGKWLFDGCILKRHRDAFLYIVDNCTAYIYQKGWSRRSFRSCDYSLYRGKIGDIIASFRQMNSIDVDYADFLENNLTEEQAAYKSRGMSISDTYLLAYEIDAGNERVINYVKNAIESGSDTAVSYKMLSGVFMSKNAELHELVCKLLLAARLQEGLRQAVCETCDGGRIEPFIMVLNTIHDNNLIRYSSVKRAVGCFIGLLTEESKDLDRISAKSIELIIRCLEDKNYIDECLKSEDSMKIYIALWATACREFRDFEKKIAEIVEHGTAHQAMTAGVFVQNLNVDARQKLAVKAVLLRHDELDVMAVYLPLMASTNTYYSNSARGQVKTDMSERYDRADAEKLYVILNQMLLELPKNDLEFNPCVFPWNVAYLTKTDIVKRLCVIAADFDEDAKIDETCVKIPLIKSTNYYGAGRSQQIRMLLDHPRTETQLDTLVSLACDKEEYSRKAVFEILNRCELSEKHFRTLEDMLKYKAADMRQNLIDVLFRQPEKQLFECVKRLCTDKKEEKRTAGLDMIIRINESEYKALAQLIEKPTSKEKILIDRICADESTEGAAEGYGLYAESDDFTPETDADFIASCKADFVKLFPGTSIFNNKPDKKKIGMHDIISALDKLIEEHKNDEYLDTYAGERLLADNSSYHRFEVKEPDGTCHIAFKELWDEFYRQHINDEKLLFKLKVYITGGVTAQKTIDKLAERVYGGEFTEKHTYMHTAKIATIVNYYCDEYLKSADRLTAACALGYYIAFEAKAEELYDFVAAPRYSNTEVISFYLDGTKMEFKNPDKKMVVTAVSDERVKLVLAMLGAVSAKLGEHFKDVFSIRFMLGKRFGFFDVSNEDRRNYPLMQEVYAPFTVCSLILAAYKGITSRGFMYKMLMEKLLSSALGDLSQLISYKKSGEAKASSRFYNYRDGEIFIRSLLEIQNLNKLSEHEFTDEDNKRLDFAAEIGEKVISAVLKTELARGDTETEFSGTIGSIKRIYGEEYFVKILAAMGKDTFDRSTYFYAYNGVSKKQALSYLLGVCVPDKDDNAAKLKELVSETDITENRMIEAALFSPAWLDIVEEYLGWNGFKSACYYFIAHMNESVDEKTKAIIAKYTPVSTEDLNVGAFDPEWFKDALQTVGEERFNKIYNAAKYISSGAKHTRARKYADAVRGKLGKADTIKDITEKRNKDTLMAYALIPLEHENDMVERYLFIQEFKKQSKKFGSQRKVSEGAAADCALQNLSKNAGFSDVSRLTLRMETRLFENIKPLLDWNDIDDIRLKIEIDDNGSAEIKCEKGGKALKSIPAKYKKDERVIAFNETKKQLTEQYRRTRQMFEEAMENETEFTAEELNLLCTNPAVKPIVSRLVYKAGDKLGFLDGLVLRSFPDKSSADNKISDKEISDKEIKITGNTNLKIAHPYDLYTDGHWHEYQRYLFENEIRQPFKQVFRELYVKTAEESPVYRSLRYAGNQIQPLKTKACLKTRRWVADVEEGLQKVYYKENIIASIYALADWFSPADIEAPTLEWVGFFDRKTYKPMKIEDVPNIIFSEVMRDVDLAVSVAHAGGVDPETSHSTIEMRKAIIEFTLPMFRLKNVRLEGTHAFIEGERADYSIHLGSGVVHLQGGPMINVLPVHSQHRGKLFLPFVDDDPKTAQIISEILLFAEDKKIKDPFILEQIK